MRERVKMTLAAERALGSLASCGRIHAMEKLCEVTHLTRAFPNQQALAKS